MFGQFVPVSNCNVTWIFLPFKFICMSQLFCTDFHSKLYVYMRCLPCATGAWELSFSINSVFVRPFHTKAKLTCGQRFVACNLLVFKRFGKKLKECKRNEMRKTNRLGKNPKRKRMNAWMNERESERRGNHKEWKEAMWQ